MIKTNTINIYHRQAGVSIIFFAVVLLRPPQPPAFLCGGFFFSGRADCFFFGVKPHAPFFGVDPHAPLDISSVSLLNSPLFGIPQIHHSNRRSRCRA